LGVLLAMMCVAQTNGPFVGRLLSHAGIALAVADGANANMNGFGIDRAADHAGLRPQPSKPSFVFLARFALA
jgi:hypothetical protein